MRFNLILAQTSIALYFGGRSLWLEKIKKGDRSWCAMGDRSPCNYRSVWYLLRRAIAIPFNSTYAIGQDTGKREQL